MAVRRRPTRGAPGQHFLRSSRLAAELVRAIGVTAGDLVVDVGAGTGVLTRALVDAGARVVALELDSTLTRDLRRRLRGSSVIVLEVDALDWVWPREAFAVFANLPFSGSGAILSRLLRDPGLPLRRADVIVQWEFAEKQARVWPATLKGTYWRTWHELSITHRLSRNAFTPAPGVDAAVLRIAPRSQPLVARDDHDRYWRFLSTAFRVDAPLALTLAEHVSPRERKRLAAVLGFSPDARPRDLDPQQWAGVFAHARMRTRPKRATPGQSAGRARTK